MEINLSPRGVFPKPIEPGSPTSDRVGSASGGMVFFNTPLGFIPHLSEGLLKFFKKIDKYEDIRYVKGEIKQQKGGWLGYEDD